MKKITILCLHLGYGGIEVAISNLANMLIDNYDIEIVSNYNIYGKPFYKLDDRIKIKYLYRKNNCTIIKNKTYTKNKN